MREKDRRYEGEKRLLHAALEKHGRRPGGRRYHNNKEISVNPAIATVLSEPDFFFHSKNKSNNKTALKKSGQSLAGVPLNTRMHQWLAMRW